MKQFGILAVLLAGLSTCGQVQAGFIIDHFQEPAAGLVPWLQSTPGGLGAFTTPGPNPLTDTTAWGGDRFGTLNVLATAGGQSSVGIFFVGDDLSYNNDAGNQSTLNLSYVAGTPTDFTQGGSNNAIVLNQVSADISTSYKITLTDGSANTAFVMLSPGTGPQVVNFLYGAFLLNNAALNLSNIVQVDLFISGGVDADVRIDRFGAGSTVPEPTSLALAGFAGIGMAVGAIRRRRQAKQAA